MNQYHIEYTEHERVYREIVFAESEEAMREAMHTHALVTELSIVSVVTYADRPLDNVRVVTNIRSILHRPDIVVVRL
jgi:hypothetical protein